MKITIQVEDELIEQIKPYQERFFTRSDVIRAAMREYVERREKAVVVMPGVMPAPEPTVQRHN